MFQELAAAFTTPFTPFALYPPASDRASWDRLSARWRRETLALGEQFADYTFPSLSATDFMDFSRTGNRVRYETKLFAKRHALDALVLAECVQHQGRFLDSVINGIFSLCEESAWQLPPHNSYERDATQLPLPDSTRPVLDLFACEAGAILATASYLLQEELDAVSPFITRRIDAELSHRIFDPYLNTHVWWMGNGTDPMNNWTIWCTQNVLLCAFLTDPGEEIRRRIFQKACRSIDYFLAEYGEDGCCDEGAQYYRHAGLCLFNAIELLNAVTDGHFAVYQDPGIRNMASYIMNVHIEDKYYVNFADCSPVAGRAGAREFLFGLRTANPDMAAFAAQDFQKGLPDTLLLPAENNLYYRLQNGFTAEKLLTYPSVAVTYPDIYYPSVGIFLARDSRFHLAVKAGDNADSHNHNDTGSFTVYKDGQPLLIDVGVESYTKKTFSADRYSIWTMQSDYHNLPTIRGYMQKDGADYHAEEVAVRMSEEYCEITMNIAPAYPAQTGLLYYRRSAALLKEKEICIKDSFAFREDPSSAPVILNLMTYEKPIPVTDGKENQPGLLVLQIGQLALLSVSEASLTVIETIPVTDPRLQTAWQHELYRIRLTLCGPEAEIHIS